MSRTVFRRRCRASPCKYLQSAVDCGTMVSAIVSFAVPILERSGARGAELRGGLSHRLRSLVIHAITLIKTTDTKVRTLPELPGVKNVWFLSNCNQCPTPRTNKKQVAPGLCDGLLLYSLRWLELSVPLTRRSPHPMRGCPTDTSASIRDGYYKCTGGGNKLRAD